MCLDEHVCVSASRDSGGLKLLSLETNLLEAVNALIVARRWFFPPPSVFASLFIHFSFFFLVLAIEDVVRLRDRLEKR